MTDLFSLGGVVKNIALDCWQFIENDISRHVDTEEDQRTEEKETLKRKKRQKRKKNQKSSNSLKVHWGEVREIYFSRELSHDTVPSSGLFPLGLGEFESEYCFSLPNLAQFPVKTRNSREETTNNEITSLLSMQPILEKDRLQLLKGQSSVASSRVASDINRDIKQIRESRECSGCLCKPLKVDKLNVAKLKAEITARKSLWAGEIFPEKMKKSELVQSLKGLLRNCELCVSNECECFRFQIPCSMLACGCIRGPVNSALVDDDNVEENTSTKTTSLLMAPETFEKEAEICANPNGKEHFDFAKVQQFRRNLLESLEK